jgi:DNA mismatch repair protein MutS
MVIIDSYLDYHHKYSKIYEQNTLVLMQVGSFFEVYSTLEEGPPIQYIGEILEIQVTKKNKSISNIDKSNHLLLGFPTHSVKKFIDILLSNNFTIILVEQTTPPPNPKREVTQIISPSTYTENSTSLSTNNYLMTIYFSIGQDMNSKEFVLSSISWVDITTNESFIYETNDTDSVINIEDTLKTISNNSPTEIVCFTDIETKSNLKIMNMLNNFIKSIPNNICIHNKLNTSINDSFFKLSYQNSIFKKVFKNTNNTMLSIIEYLDLEMKHLSIISFAYLLQFVYEHSDKIINGIKKPIFLENHKYLSLVNNALENLNIVSNKSNSKTSSLINLLNNCKTSIGKRFFKQCLINPLTDPIKINERYDHCEIFIKNDLYKEIRVHLSKISDIEKLYKRIILGSLQPSEFVNIHNSLEALVVLTKYNFKNMNWTNDKQSCLDVKWKK